MNGNTQSLVLPFEEARRVVEEHAAGLTPSNSEPVQILQSLGRILAEEVRADRDFPPFSRAARDGFAVRSEDVLSAPTKLKIVAEVRAGEKESRQIGTGQAVEIMTGAPVPAGADAVVMVEYTSRKEENVTIERSVEAGENIVHKGSEARQGDILLARGHRIDHAAISVLAAVGKSELKVFTLPKVAILATGDELVEIKEKPGPSQIRNSNTYSLAAQVMEAGGNPVLLPIAPDDPERLRELLQEGLKSDLLLISGGVSMGKYDLVEKVLANFGAEFFFTGALIQPGKPVVFGRTSLGKYFLGLPGNPVSTMVTFELFARPLITSLAGAPVRKLCFVQAKLKADIHVNKGLTRFFPAFMEGEYHDAVVERIPTKGSGDIAAVARANCYIVVPRNRDHIFADEMVHVML